MIRYNPYVRETLLKNVFYIFDIFKGIQILVYANIFSLYVACDKESVSNIAYVFSFLPGAPGRCQEVAA
jgi:hypothetical protein